MSTPDKVFEALASTTRRKILAYLSEGPLTAGVVAERFEMSQPAVSKHLSILESEFYSLIVRYSGVFLNLKKTFLSSYLGPSLARRCFWYK